MLPQLEHCLFLSGFSQGMLTFDISSDLLVDGPMLGGSRVPLGEILRLDRSSGMAAVVVCSVDGAVVL